ncbi:PREDICTED: serine/arginine repetitive matrix protein 1-like [Erythranthe guttata]|uniref:serine/arginine repetitive matrix protein 1-like n=1 Tax=Erythranthe guttata TaxID=4155 RepID=UPI00064DC029|nr:PREDICTED: serine/arginine repetitive matrix protein 1-like [Erythranthe guttata]|eukprot:XP_012831394.1 PREDICTED: serine/arginine repetitive matrix protein 1-like [Erythranthe guttata]
MASPFPAKSQTLHNFTLQHLRWNKDGQSSGGHPHRRRRSVKSPSRRPSPSSASPVRQSPFRDSVSSTPPRYQSPLRDSAAAAASPPPPRKYSDQLRKKSPTGGESSKSYQVGGFVKPSPIGAGGNRVRHFPSPDLAPPPEPSGKGKASTIEHRRNHHPKNSPFDNPKNGVYSTHSDRPSHKFETKPRVKEADASGIKKSKILIKIPPRKNSNNKTIEDPQSEPPKPPDSNTEKIDEAEQMREEGKINNATDEEIKTWNLRPRKPIRKSSNVNGGTSVKNNGARADIPMPEKIKAESPLQNPNSRSMENKLNPGEKKEKRKLSVFVSLSKDEIEEDIFSLTGSKPARRPKKRAKNVQKQVDSICPGSWLVSITADSYKVSENSMKG